MQFQARLPFDPLGQSVRQFRGRAIARHPVGYEEFSTLHRLCLRWCGLSPAPFRDHIRQVKSLLRELPEDVFSWHFLERCRRGELSTEEVRRLIRHIRQANGLT